MHVLIRGNWTQRARIASGLILFLFVLLHFSNHAVGLWDLRWMEKVQDWRMQITRYNAVVPWVLIAALVVHLVLGIAGLLRRRSLRMPGWEAVQIISGLLIPFMIAPHIVHTRIAGEFFGVHEFYRYELAKLWPANAWWQSAGLLLVWVHACIGLHHWLRLTRWWQRALPVLTGLAILVPALSLAGFVAAGRRVARMVNHPPSFARLKKMTGWPDDAGTTAIHQIAGNTLLVALGAALLILAIWYLRVRFRRRSGIQITYRYGPTVRAAPGQTLLEVSRANDVPHASLCGGRGRCTTCRVMVEEGAASLTPPGEVEARSLASVGAPEGTRLACQIVPSASLTVHKLFHTAENGRLAEDGRRGEEGQRAILFLDVRDFTRISAGRLPYDVLFLLNRFFAIVTPEIERRGGEVDKYLGDGLLAVFGSATDAAGACRAALAAAAEIDLALDTFNETLVAEGHEPLRIGMGLHVGELVIGAIGAGASASQTIIGEVVNTASRLETLCKELGAQLVVSEAVAAASGIGRDAADFVEVDVRGLSGARSVARFERARDVPAPARAAVS